MTAEVPEGSHQICGPAFWRFSDGFGVREWRSVDGGRLHGRTVYLLLRLRRVQP